MPVAERMPATVKYESPAQISITSELSQRRWEIPSSLIPIESCFLQLWNFLFPVYFSGTNALALLFACRKQWSSNWWTERRAWSSLGNLYERRTWRVFRVTRGKLDLSHCIRPIPSRNYRQAYIFFFKCITSPPPPSPFLFLKSVNHFQKSSQFFKQALQFLRTRRNEFGQASVEFPCTNFPRNSFGIDSIVQQTGNFICWTELLAKRIDDTDSLQQQSCLKQI